MKIYSINVYSNNKSVSLQQNFTGKKNKKTSPESKIQKFLEPFSYNKEAKVPSGTIMKGVNPDNSDVFDTFTKIDDATRSINFVKSRESWTNCLLEEIVEFNQARSMYESNQTEENYDHMEEEMGDILYTASSIAKDSEIDPKKAFKATNRKFYNRINLMERLAASSDSNTPKQLKDCKDFERRALWNFAKQSLYNAQAGLYKKNKEN